MAGDELGEVTPVRADVGERARGPAWLFVHTPVRVVGEQEPVLKVRAVQQMDRSGPTASNALARFADGRVVAVDERHARMEPRPGCDVREALRPASSVGQRLLADHVLAGFERGLGERQMEVVRGADVDDVRSPGRAPSPRRSRTHARRRAPTRPRRRTRATRRRRRRARRRPGATSARGPSR